MIAQVLQFFIFLLQITFLAAMILIPGALTVVAIYAFLKKRKTKGEDKNERK